MNNSKYKSILLDVFKEFIHICEAHHLRYFCIGGTLIGVIRHQGFIPWDDDIDVGMPRDDYERFLEIYQNLKDKRFALIKPTATNNYYLPFAKLYDKSTQLLEKDTACILGIYVDIFPLDGTSDDYNERGSLMNNYIALKERFWSTSRSNSDKIKELLLFFFRLKFRKAVEVLGDVFANKKNRGRLIAKMERLATRYPYDNAIYINNYGGAWGISEVALMQWFKGHEIKKFEGLDVRVPNGYHNYLTNIYGDYMKPVPKEQQVSRHDIVYVNY